MSIDALAVGAHPDDVELGIGGTIAKLTSSGKSVVLLDLTRGEMGSRGTPEIRKAESEKASTVLGIKERVTLDLGDSILQSTLEARKQVMEVIRKYRPTIIFAPYWDDLHPDHAAAGIIVKSTIYPSGFTKYPAAGEPYRANGVLFFMMHTEFNPSLVVDVTGYHEKKIEAIKCYASQLHTDKSNEPKTNLSRPGFISKLEARAMYFGSSIGTEYGEPFLTIRNVPVQDPVNLYFPFKRI